MSDTYNSRAGIASRSASQSARRLASLPIATAAAALLCLAACSDSPVSYFDSPTSIPISTTGIQNAVTGLFGSTRSDQGDYLWESAGFARDLGWFLGASPNTLTDVIGLVPGANANTTLICCRIWNTEYEDVKQANTIMASLPKVTSYSAPQMAAITGVLQTLKALNFMYLAETRDTLGIPLYAIDSNPVDPPYCNQDVWKYIVALLDSGFSDLNTAGSIPLPIPVPAGFASVGQTAAPSTTLGSFASFNRALAGKAGLELAYAIARSTVAGAPTPTTPGAPDVAALTRGDSALTASALNDPTAIAPPAAGAFALDPHGVYHTFSGQSGDQGNPVNANNFFDFVTLFDFTTSVDTLHDLRWLAKFVQDPQSVQVGTYAGVADPHLYGPYASVNSPVPIVRAEELALVRAQIQLGLGNFAAALTLVNDVRTQAGGLTAYPGSDATGPNAFVQVRNDLMKEQRISTVFEGSGDRMIALRMYGLQATADTTWQAKGGPDGAVDSTLKAVDYHTTIATLPAVELSERGGSWNLKCP